MARGRENNLGSNYWQVYLDTSLLYVVNERERRQRQGSFEPPFRGRPTTQRQYADILE